MNQERRKHKRLPVMRNVGSPIELQVIKDHRKISIPGFMMNLSAGGMRVMTLGSQTLELALGTPFVLNLSLPQLIDANVEGTIINIQRADKAKLHGSNDEWFLGLSFSKIKPSDARQINHMAGDWDICETKIQMGLPDVCYKECKCWHFCDKDAKLK